MSAKTIIAPSILSADFANLEKDIKMLDRSSADWVHIDVMDGNFVPNISFGFPIIKAIRPLTKKIFDAHLMINYPEKYIEDFRKAGADIITVHYEACTHLHRVVEQIKQSGAKAGVAVNPHTPISLLESIISSLDLVLIMSVNPGFGGQKFIEATFDKLKDLKSLCEKHNCQPFIEVDGGVNDTLAPSLLEKGANVLVAGSYIFNSDSPEEQINKLITN